MSVVRVKKIHKDAQIPAYATEGAGCFDLSAVGLFGGPSSLFPGESVVFRTGLVFEIPEGWVMAIFSRSGHGFNFDTRLSNCVGIIDSDYRGEVMVKLKNDGKNKIMHVKNKDRIAQAMLIPAERVIFDVVDEVSETERGDGGFGSTGC